MKALTCNMGHSWEKESQNCSAQGFDIRWYIRLAVSYRPVNRAHSLGVILRPLSRAWMSPPGNMKIKGDKEGKRTSSVTKTLKGLSAVIYTDYLINVANQVSFINLVQYHKSQISHNGQFDCKNNSVYNGSPFNSGQPTHFCLSVTVYCVCCSVKMCLKLYVPANMRVLTQSARPCMAAFIKAVKPWQFLLSMSSPGK